MQTLNGRERHNPQFKPDQLFEQLKASKNMFEHLNHPVWDSYA